MSNLSSFKYKRLNLAQAISNPGVPATLSVEAGRDIQNNFKLLDELLDGALINVKEYGAKGDGVTNDSTSIQNAINALQNTGKVLFFPPGTYKIDTQLVWKGVSMCGHSRWSVFLKSANSNGILLSTASISNVTINEITFQGTDFVTSGKGISITTSHSNIFITNCNFNNNLNLSIDLVDSVNVHIDKCLLGAVGVATNHQQLSIVGTGPGSATTVFVTDSYFSYATAAYGIFNQNASHVIYQRCIFEVFTTTESGIRVKGCQGLDFIECWFEQINGPYMLKLTQNDAASMGARGISFIRNTFNGSTAGGTALSSIIYGQDGAGTADGSWHFEGNRGNLLGVPLTDDDGVLAASRIRNYFGNSNPYNVDQVAFAKPGDAVVTYGSAAPSTGYWRIGSRVYNTSPSGNGREGWICVTEGVPGTWKLFGSIAP